MSPHLQSQHQKASSSTLMAGGCFPWDKKSPQSDSDMGRASRATRYFALKYCRPGAVPQRQATCLVSPHFYENKTISESCVETYLPITKHTFPTWTSVSCSKAIGGSCRHFLVHLQQWPCPGVKAALTACFLNFMCGVCVQGPTVWRLCTWTCCVASVYMDLLCGICVRGPAVGAWLHMFVEARS